MYIGISKNVAFPMLVSDLHPQDSGQPLSLQPSLAWTCAGRGWNVIHRQPALRPLHQRRAVTAPAVGRALRRKAPKHRAMGAVWPVEVDTIYENRKAPTKTSSLDRQVGLQIG